MSVSIQLEWTPNPSTLKYVVDQRLLPAAGALNFTTAEATEGKSPLARMLFGIHGVTGVMLGINFVTITKGEDGEWDELNDAVMAALDKFLSSGEQPAVLEGAMAPPPQSSGGGSAVENKIREVLDVEIRPSVMMDGGDIQLDRFENGIVYLQMKGSCSGCPSSTMTLKMGIENRLRDLIPEVNEVVSV